MSTTEAQEAQEFADHMVKEHKDPARGLLHRTFATAITSGEGRTIDVRIVPYGERVVHDDGLGGVPKGLPYTEEFAPGAFSHQVKAANRVLLNFEHQRGIGGIVGHGTALLEANDGFYGSFKIHDTPDGEKALMLVREGVLGGVSLEAFPKKSVRTAAGVIQRVKAHLQGVSLCREPAYASSVVLALREQADIVLDEELLPVEPDPELLDRCRRLGIQIPQRYEAHPAEGTPDDESGTPEDGTRPETETETESSEV